MACNHEQFKCTNGVFFCLICGAEIGDPFAVKEDTDRAEKPAEAPQEAKKRTRKSKKPAQ